MIIAVGSPEFVAWCDAFAAEVASRPKPRKLPFACGLCLETIKPQTGYPHGRCPHGKCPPLTQICPPEVDEFDTRTPLNAAEFKRLVADDRSGQRSLFEGE